MSTLSTDPAEDTIVSPAPRSRGWRRPLLALSVLVVLAALVTSRTDLGSRVRNPKPAGTHLLQGTPHANAPFLGFSNWPLAFEIFSIIVAVVCYTISIRRSRREGRWTPTLLLLVATTLITWLDPVMNWLPYAAYDPRLLHFPESWPWVSLAPTVEPLVIFVGYPYYFLLPAWFTLWFYGRFVADRSWAKAYPLAVIAALSYVICVVWDFATETTFVRMEIYCYTQAVPGWSVREGTSWQFPLYESLIFGIVLAAAPVLMWRDASGQNLCERVAARGRFAGGVFGGRPLAVAFAIMSLVYLVGDGLPMGIIRITDSASSVARPWPYQDTKVFDPQNFYRDSGEPGPYMKGVWSRLDLGR